MLYFELSSSASSSVTACPETMRRPLGQHFLFDRNILNRIVDASGIGPEDEVIEIGAGLGSLTRILSKRAKRVTAIEYDRKLAESLRAKLAGEENVELITANALKVPYETFGNRLKVVANIPYYITTPLIFRLLEYRKQIEAMTLLVQKEIAERIVASPGGKQYGVLSITVQVYARPEIKFAVSRKAFTPPPAVDSAVVHFEVSASGRFGIDDEPFFVKVVKTAFSQRRKTLANSLKAYQGIKPALEMAGIAPTSRPEVLSIEDFIKLSDALRTTTSQG